MEVKRTYLGTMIGLATVAFGLIAAGAWNQFISDMIAPLSQIRERRLGGLIYAVLVTIVAIVVVQWLAKLAEKEAAIAAKLPLEKAVRIASPTRRCLFWAVYPRGS